MVTWCLLRFKKKMIILAFQFVFPTAYNNFANPPKYKYKTYKIHTTENIIKISKTNIIF